jgi:hypothetical protein
MEIKVSRLSEIFFMRIFGDSHDDVAIAAVSTKALKFTLFIYFYLTRDQLGNET